MAAKNRRSGKSKSPRRGISGNPQRRAEQLAQRRPAITGEPDLSPLVMDFRSGKPENSAMRELAYALAGGAKPAPWWSASHERVLASARALDWPAQTLDVEAQACRIVGDEFYEMLNSAVTGLAPAQWLVSLAEKAGAALNTAIRNGDGDWEQLWALLCGLALISPAGDTGSENAKLAREQFPDIKDPYETALAEAGKGAKLLADRGLVPGIGAPADGCRPAGAPLVARDAYGSRFLVAAPFGYGQDQGGSGDGPDHWYTWDIDWCWTTLSWEPGRPGRPRRRCANGRTPSGPRPPARRCPRARPRRPPCCWSPALQTGPLSDVLQGSEPRELIREFYRLRRRARVLAAASSAGAASPGTSGGTSGAFDTFDADDAGQLREAFLAWYTARHGVTPQGEDADTIIQEWGPRKLPDQSWFYACSPHRIEMTAILIRDGYLAGYANAALRLLPEWTQWCIERSGLTGDFAARSRDAALTEAATLVDEEADEGAGRRDHEPFRRRE